MKRCDAVRQRLAEAGIDLIDTDAEIRTHLADCRDCERFAIYLNRVETGLQDLSIPNAPDSLVAATLDAVRDVEHQKKDRSQFGGRRSLAAGLAAAVVIGAGIVLTLNIMESVSPYQTAELEEVADGGAYGPRERDLRLGAPAPKPAADPQEQGVLQRLETEMARTIDETARIVERQKKEMAKGKAENRDIVDLVQKEAAVGDFRSREARYFDLSESAVVAQLMGLPESGGSARTAGPGDRSYDLDKNVFGAIQPRTVTEAPAAFAEAEGDDLGRLSSSRPSMSAAKQGVQSPPRSSTQSNEASPDAPATTDEQLATRADLGAEPADEKAVITKSDDREEVRGFADTDPIHAGEAGGGEGTSRMGNEPIGGTILMPEAKRLNAEIPVNLDAARARAGRFLQSYDSLDGLTFREATGYWANTYIPGDPEMRLLQARLANWDRTALGREVRLEQAVQPVSQPFDAPRHAALALYLQADKAAIEGQTRLRLQVGLKGADRQGGRRPGMNVGVVLDLRSDADLDAATRIQALVMALERMAQPGDRFSLSVAGLAGGLLIEPSQFKHGPLRTTLAGLLGATPSPGADIVELIEAIDLATENVRQGDDPNAVLGSSLVLLVTSDSLADDIGALEGIAHRNAIDGIPMSVVSLGRRDEIEHIDRLVAAGQGNRRIFSSPSEATGLLDRELHAASRVVARAVRLRIRLAPEVKLVDVLGSQPLDVQQAERVRAAEQSIDQRLARNLGIESDRGDDEEGIQIVIPNFYAGDTHVILLDVVADGPGPIADVTARYKDLVGLRNAVTRASLAIGDDQRFPRPMERNVTKNVVTWEIARQTREIGRSLAESDTARAIEQLMELRELVVGLRLSVAGWSEDPDLTADESMLTEYLSVLDSPAVANAEQRFYLAQSLRYAAFRKLQLAAR